MRYAKAILGSRSLFVYVPETGDERRRGLQDYSVPSDSDAMFFEKGPVWMAELAYPIDIVLLRGTRVDWALSVEPGDVTQYGLPGHAVLELAPGWARRHRLRVGDRLRWL